MLVGRWLSLFVALGLVLGACSSGDGEPQGRLGDGGPPAAEPLRLAVVGTERVSPHRTLGPVGEPDRAAVLEVLQTTFDATVVEPLAGNPPASIESVFTAPAAERATGADRAALFDEGLPAVDRLVGDKTNVRLTGLEGDDASLALVVAKIDWDVRSADGSVRIQRIGELSLIPVFGSWLVGAYSVITTRTISGATTTTTAATS